MDLKPTPPAADAEQREPGRGEGRPAEPGTLGIRQTDRVLIAGQNGSGKSELLNYLVTTGYRCQKLIVDTKDEFTVAGVEPTRHLSEIDWEKPVIHYIDDGGDLGEYDALFRACLQRRGGRIEGPRVYGLVVVVHELADLCGDTPGATPRWVNAYIRKGRAHGLGLLAGAQRPVNIPKAARTEAQHIFAFAPGFDPDDRAVIAKAMSVSEPELEQHLVQAAHTSPTGEHAFVWFQKRGRTITICSPLPDDLRRQTMIRGLAP